MATELSQLNDLTFGQITLWLERALRGQEQVPRLSPDESPYLGIMRAESGLEVRARRDLQRACYELVGQFAATGQGDVDYLHALLCLAVELGQKPAANLLRRLVDREPTWAKLADEIQALVLATLVDLKVPQGGGFWSARVTQNALAFSGIALSALLDHAPAEALVLLPELPSDDEVASAAALLLGLYCDDLQPSQRSLFMSQIKDRLPRCSPLMRDSLAKWLMESGIDLAPERSPRAGASPAIVGLLTRLKRSPKPPSSSRLAA